MLIRILAITITVILMVLSVVLNGTFSRLMYLLPCALVIGLILTLMWLGIPTGRRNRLWNQLVSRWRFPLRSLILVTGWTLLLTLLPVCRCRTISHGLRCMMNSLTCWEQKRLFMAD